MWQEHLNLLLEYQPNLQVQQLLFQLQVGTHQHRKIQVILKNDATLESPQTTFVTSPKFSYNEGNSVSGNIEQPSAHVSCQMPILHFLSDLSETQYNLTINAFSH